jgi:hypothetical protein
MFLINSLHKKQNTIKVSIQKYNNEVFKKNVNGILLKKYCNDFNYKKNIDSDSDSDKNNNSLIPFDNDNNNNNIIIILFASVTTSICFYFYKYLKM